MKPRWERRIDAITAENFYSWTGCTDGLLMRYLLLRYVEDLFEDHFLLEKGFAFVRLSSSCDIQAVCDGSIVDVEFHLQPIGAGMQRVWMLSLSSVDALVVEKLFQKLLEYLEKGIATFVEIDDETMGMLEAGMLKKIEAFLSKPKYEIYCYSNSSMSQ
ncbi:MAG: hypothetical protein US25_C0023G0007 [Candidatus Moranbacteria bacterium GW2011_GWE1_36_7]|nr:MAG: hypothetical protein UR99_C0013G0010 [Candidatus Moranbacteria bacterium GW2011_GWD2_36_12]KKQ06489.1 MAG: hypothetical protein US16_C0016G0007 [Candidatus Moranbacteria bacterium GW2011_GWE2_36_40]KKQ14696.1 MAG: hypothetical protein US25_C0023G0007 [Candidatus Moranbacteria bacterium GW2011_GWE1_36_7]